MPTPVLFYSKFLISNMSPTNGLTIHLYTLAKILILIETKSIIIIQLNK